MPACPASRWGWWPRGRSLLAAALLFAAWYLNGARGVGWMVVFFVALVLALNYALTRTQWGTWMLAVGGNKEAARRSGIDVRAVVASAFVLCSSLAALGGVLGRVPAGRGQPGQRRR